MRRRLEVPLIFDAGGETLHCPMVAAEVGGAATLLIVDTGATMHLLTLELCASAGLEVTPGDPGTDTTGALVESWTVEPLDVAVGGGAVTLHEVVAIAAPPPFPGWGIGGILSPQRLQPDATVTLDLILGVLTIGSSGDPGAPRGPMDDVVVDRHGSGTLGVTMTVGARGPLVALLDTGASTTEVVAGSTGSTSVTGRGVSGDETRGGVLLEQAVEIGPVRRRLDRLHVRDAIPVPEGAGPGEIPAALIGMDLLAETVVVIPPAPAPVVWSFPSS